MDIFTQDELVITEVFKDIKPWKGDKLEKWQNYLTNLCVVNRMSIIPTLSFPTSINDIITGSHHTIEPPTIHLNCFSVQDLLVHFYNFRAEWSGNKADNDKAIEYSVSLFYSVWPETITKIVFCPENKFNKSIALGLSEAIKRNPKYKMSNVQICKEHKIDIPVKLQYYSGQLHPEFN